MNIRCTTNLDDCKREQWPESFVCIPRVGDFVQAKSGTVLKVITVTHKIFYRWSSDQNCADEGMLELYLGRIA